MNYDRKGNPIFYHFEESEGIVINLKNDENGYPILYDKDGKIVEYRKNINEKEEKEEDKDKEVNSYKIKEIKIKNGDWNKSTVKIEKKSKRALKIGWVYIGKVKNLVIFLHKIWLC